MTKGGFGRLVLRDLCAQKTVGRIERLSTLGKFERSRTVSPKIRLERRAACKTAKVKNAAITAITRCSGDGCTARQMVNGTTDGRTKAATLGRCTELSATE